MKHRVERGAGLLLAALLLAGAGCAHFRKPRPAPAPAPEPAAPETAADATNAAPAAPRTHLVVDTNQVLELQNRELEKLRCEDEADLHPRNGFTHWLDCFHERTYRRMDNAVRRVDTMWLTEEVRPYDYELSTFKLKPMVKIGGRSENDDTEFKVKFRMDLALPGLKRRLHLFLDNAGRDFLPGQDAMDKEGDTRLGARSVRTLKNSDLDLGGGLRMHSGEPLWFADLEWRWKWGNITNGMLQLLPRGYWYSDDDGFGQTTVLSWTRSLGEATLFQLRAAERSTEQTGGVELEQSIRFGWLRSAKTRGLVLQMSAFPHYKNSGLTWDDYLVNVTWRGALYRKWIYYTLTPQVEFPHEDDYHAKPSIRIALELLMGGKIGELF